VRFELRTPEPLLRSIFRDRGFTVETLILALLSLVFVPFFFFASVYSQAPLGKTASNAGIYMLYIFFGFVAAAQIGGRILDRRGARPAVVLGAVGFYLLAGRLTHLSLSAQWVDIAIAGAGLGLMLGVASTDAVDRASSSSYSEVTGITQTVRNFGASLGLAVLGSILINRNRVEVPAALSKIGVPKGTGLKIAASLGSSSGGSAADGH
jgi:predicted MFS family arabinose efflux permease